MAFGFLGAPQQQNRQQGGIGALRPGPNYQSGPQGWQSGYGIGLPMSSGDHMPLISTSQSHRPPQQAMAPGQPQQRMQPPGLQQQPHGGGGPIANEPWNNPGWVQPTPTYNAPAWGSNAIGWGGSGNAPPRVVVDPIGSGGPIGDPLPPAPAVAAGSGGPSSVGAGLPAGQWQSIIQALSGFGSNMFNAPQASGGYTDPRELQMLLAGLGGGGYR